MNPPTLSKESPDEQHSPGERTYKLVSWVCLTTALLHMSATLAGVFLIRAGNLGDFVPLKLLRFIPPHVELWRLTWLAAALATISFVVLTVILREVFDRRVETVLLLAVVLATIGAASDLNGEFSMMIMFSDLAYQLRSHGSFLQQETVQLAWAVMNQSVTNSVLVGNSLLSVAGIMLSAASLLTRGFPGWLAWLGMPIWFAMFNISVMTFFGVLQWAMVLTMASALAFSVWAMLMGFHFNNKARESHEAELHGGPDEARAGRTGPVH